MGEKISQIKGFDFAFIHCGQNKGRIVSVDWIDVDGSSIWTIASTDSEDEDRSLIQSITSKDHPTRILVKLWDIGNDVPDRLFEVANVAVTQFSPNGQYLAVGRQSENVLNYGIWRMAKGFINSCKGDWGTRLQENPQ